MNQKEILAQIHQGTELEKNESFVVLICSKDDIRQRLEENDEPITEERVNKIYQVLKRKMTDMIMDDFWLCVDHGIEYEDD